MLIDTKYGQIDEDELRKVVHVDSVEFYLGEDLVHRSATTGLEGLAASAVLSEALTRPNASEES